MLMSLKNLDAYVVHLEERQAELWLSFQEARSKTNAAKMTLAGMEEWENPGAAEGRPKQYHAHIGREDIIDCKTQRAALEKIASMSQGIVRTGEAADLILAAELSKGTKATVVATSHRTMTEDEQSWTWIAPGTFRRNSERPSLENSNGSVPTHAGQSALVAKEE